MQLALTRAAPTRALSLTYANVSREPATADRTRALLLHNARDDRRRTPPKLGGSLSTSRGGSFFASAAARIQAAHPTEVAALDAQFDHALAEPRDAATAFLDARDTPHEPAARDALRTAAHRVDAVRAETRVLIKTALPDAETRDTDFVFLSFVLDFMPIGLVGLLIAVILCAAMGSVSSELIITTNLDYAEWANFLGNKALVGALLSRLRHQCHTVKIDGPSLRDPESNLTPVSVLPTPFVASRRGRCCFSGSPFSHSCEAAAVIRAGQMGHFS